MVKEVLLKKGLYLKKGLCAQTSLVFLCYALYSSLQPLPATSLSEGCQHLPALLFSDSSIPH